MSYGEWRPYVSVAQRRANAAREIKKLRKKGLDIEPISIQGQKIVSTFWGKAWCKHLEQFSDFDNRLPRGRTYVRNGSVCHLVIKKGEIDAIVSGSQMYKVNIRIAPLAPNRWKNVRKQCAGQIGSILELLEGRLSDQVMTIVTDPTKGLFPQPRDIKLHCDCPDWADMCKHVAAVLYGVGARLDKSPELLFLLRKVEYHELISGELDILAATTGTGKRRQLAKQDLSTLFGVDIDDTVPTKNKTKTTRKKTARHSPGVKSDRKVTVARRGKSRTGQASVTSKTRTFTPTGAAVSRLRKRLRMTRASFSTLLDVSPPTITNWEAKRGKLKLQRRTLKALTRVWLQQ